VRGVRRGPAPAHLVWLVVVVGLAVVVGFSLTGRGGSPDAARRAASLDAVLKCPSCDGISVADSSASSAAAIRQVVLARVRAGQSDEQIESYLVGLYGPSILLDPPRSGLTTVVWVAPAVAAAGGLGGLALFFWRRRRPAAVAVTSADEALVDEALAEAAGWHGARR